MKSTLIILFLIIILASTLSCYKIESFVNYVPQTPTAYNFIAKNKEWDVNILTKEQLFVLFTMRALQGKHFTSNNREFPLLDGVVIPYKHLPVFNRDPSDKSPMLLKRTTAKPTHSEMHPNGLYINLTELSFQDFRSVLDTLYKEYDSDYIYEYNIMKQRKEKIYNEIKPLEDNLMQLEQQLKYMTEKTKEAKTMYENELATSQKLNEEIVKYRACG